MGFFHTEIKTGAMLLVTWHGAEGEPEPSMQAIVGQARRAAGPSQPVRLVAIGRVSNSIFASFRRQMD